MPYYINEKRFHKFYTDIGLSGLMQDLVVLTPREYLRFIRGHCADSLLFGSAFSNTSLNYKSVINRFDSPPAGFLFRESDLVFLKWHTYTSLASASRQIGKKFEEVCNSVLAIEDKTRFGVAANLYENNKNIQHACTFLKNHEGFTENGFNLSTDFLLYDFEYTQYVYTDSIFFIRVPFRFLLKYTTDELDFETSSDNFKEAFERWALTFRNGFLDAYSSSDCKVKYNIPDKLSKDGYPSITVEDDLAGGISVFNRIANIGNIIELDAPESFFSDSKSGVHTHVRFTIQPWVGKLRDLVYNVNNLHSEVSYSGY